MTNSRWRKASRIAINGALESGRAAGLEGKELEKHIQAAYPFGERAMTPYKMWREEFNLLVKGKPRPFEARKQKGPKLLGEWPGQGKLDLKD